MSCFILPRSESFPSPKTKTKTKTKIKRGWKHLVRRLRSKALPLLNLKGSINLRSLHANQYSSSTHRHYYHNNYHRQCHYPVSPYPYPGRNQNSSPSPLSLSRMEGGCRDDKAVLVLASNRSVLTTSTGHREKDEHAHDHHHVLEDGLGFHDDKSLDLDEVYKNITHGHHHHEYDDYAVPSSYRPSTNTIPTTPHSNSPTLECRRRLCGVDAEADKFIEKFRKTLQLERQKSAEEFWAMLA